ncbi:hypothetical protein [Stieleria varia]|uniref:Uncharacterized protein n=1 Tax=Stieleria varia TaxID=2528005 RepID=A0A5C6B0Q6_9BACT|nr:hypothetical protein [Stieleria varia]TWU04876.1 hypothetical protein Pla52n_29210 [Stieleria varia]
MPPHHSIDFCPVCGGGLCGVRICGVDSPDHLAAYSEQDSSVRLPPHGLVICDECEAIWLEPDLQSDHLYADPIDSRCPICSESLWGEQSRWADEKDLKLLGWSDAIDRSLDVPAEKPDQGYRTGEGMA